MKIYLDNSATTRPYDEAIEEMVISMKEFYGNPSSVHDMGIEASNRIKKSRSEIAKSLGVNENEIVFTSGGTEANNTAIKGICKSYRRRGNHIISTAIEHSSVLGTLKSMEEEGFRVTYLKPDQEGNITSEQVKNAIEEDTILVSIMQVNNELGTIMPIGEIGQMLSKEDKKIYFHVDGVQSFMKMEVKPSKLNIDLYSASSHKIHGPKGVGFLYISNKTNLKPLLEGGGQEMGIRSGTEGVPNIIGFGKAVELERRDMNSRIEKIKSLKELMRSLLEEKIENIRINSPLDGVCHILNVSFRGVRGEILLHSLEEQGIYVSTTSACSSKKKGSHVLDLLRLTSEEKEGALRFSLGNFNSEEEIHQVVKILSEIVPMLRKITSRR